MRDYPNARDCKHGHLARSCEVCDLEQQVQVLTEALRRERAALLIAAQERCLTTDPDEVDWNLERWRKDGAAFAAADQTDEPTRSEWAVENLTIPKDAEPDRWAPVKEAWANDPTHDSIYYAVERVMRADQPDEGDK